MAEADSRVAALAARNRQLLMGITAPAPVATSLPTRNQPAGARPRDQRVVSTRTTTSRTSPTRTTPPTVNIKTSYFTHNSLNLPPWQHAVTDKSLEGQRSNPLDLGCRCSACQALLKKTSSPVANDAKAAEAEPFKVGSRVILTEDRTGIVKWIGKLQGYEDYETLVGVQLDEPMGDTDGTINGKRYFSCPEHHGLCVPVSHVLYFKHRMDLSYQPTAVAVSHHETSPASASKQSKPAAKKPKADAAKEAQRKQATQKLLQAQDLGLQMQAEQQEEWATLMANVTALTSDSAQLDQFWDHLDVNSNGLVSLAELDKMIVESYPLLNRKPALMRAFKWTTAGSGDGEWVRREDVGALLLNVLYFNRAWAMFDVVDGDDDRRVTFEEFCQGAAALDLHLTEADARVEFDGMDVNGGGLVLFDEFCTWLANTKRHQ